MFFTLLTRIIIRQNVAEIFQRRFSSSIFRWQQMLYTVVWRHWRIGAHVTVLHIPQWHSTVSVHFHFRFRVCKYVSRFADAKNGWTKFNLKTENLMTWRHYMIRTSCAPNTLSRTMEAWNCSLKKALRNVRFWVIILISVFSCVTHTKTTVVCIHF